MDITECFFRIGQHTVVVLLFEHLSHYHCWMCGIHQSIKVE